MNKFSILILAVACCFFTHEANAQDKPKEEPAQKAKENQAEKAKFTPLDLSGAATVASTRIFNKESLSFPKWGKQTYHDVPFLVIDPDGGKTKNGICLYSPLGTVSAKMPKSVRLECGLLAKGIHVLGAAGWGVPWSDAKNTLSMVIRVEYADGGTEDHEVRNGVHLTDWAKGPDVPGSKSIGVEQVRYFSIVPKRQDAVIRTIEFRKGTDKTSPLVMAVTVETLVSQVAQMRKEGSRTIPAFTVKTRGLTSFKANAFGCIEFSPDGKLVLTGDSDGNATIWDVEKSEKRQTWERKNRAITSAAFSPDGKLVAICSTARRPLSEVRIYEASGKHVVTLDPLKGLIGVGGDASAIIQDSCKTFAAFSTDGKTLCIGVQPWTGDVADAETQQVILVSTESWKQVIRIPATPRIVGKGNYRAIFSPQPDSIAPAGVTIVVEDGMVMDVRNGRKIPSPAKILPKAAGPVGAFAASPDHELWAVSKREAGEVVLWDVGRKEKLETLAHSGRVTRLAFSPNGRMLAVCCNDGLVKLWEVTIEATKDSPSLSPKKPTEGGEKPNPAKKDPASRPTEPASGSQPAVAKADPKDAPPQEPSKPQPKIIGEKTWTWDGAKESYARYSDLVFEVGMGDEKNGVGCADAGVEIEKVRSVKLSVEAPPSFKRHDANSFAGFMVDYHTTDGYTKRVALSIGMYSEKRWTKTPIWGKGTTPDKFIDLGKKKEYDLDLKEWAPDSWDGKVWFVVSLQNTGRNTTLKASLSLTGEEKKADVGQKQEEKLDKEVGLTDEHYSAAKAFVSLMREAAASLKNAQDKMSVEKTSDDLKRLAASLLDLNTKATKLPQLSEAGKQRLRQMYADDVRTMLKESLEAYEEFDKSVKRLAEEKTVPAATLTELRSSYKTFLGAMATVGGGVIGSWKLFVPQEGDITWDFFPLTEGQVRIYDTETKSPDVPGVSIIRDKYTIMKGGAIERTMLKTGAKGDGAKDVTWVLENNQKLPTQSVRQHNGFVEIGTPVLGKTTTSWEPILKLMANDGDKWEWKSDKGIVRYQIQAGLKHMGQPAVQVTKSTRDADGFEIVEKITYVKNVGLVEATRDSAKEGKPFLKEVKRLVDGNTVPPETLKKMALALAEYSAAMAEGGRVAGSWKLFEKGVTEVTADYYPFTKGSSRFVDVELMLGNGTSSVMRSKIAHLEDGRIESTIVKVGLKKAGDGEVQWLRETNQKSKDPRFFRERDGFIEIGTRLEGMKELSWEPILKIGAKDGDTWESKNVVSTSEYRVKTDVRHKGRPAIQITKVTRFPSLEIETTAQIIYVEGVGQVESSTRSVGKDGKELPSGATRLVE